MYIIYTHIYIHIYIYIYTYVYNLCVYFKLKSVCIIQNLYFHFLFLLKITIILCSKCTLFHLRRNFKMEQLIANRSFKIHDFYLKNAMSNLYKTISSQKFFYYNPFFNIEKQNFTHILYILYLW